MSDEGHGEDIQDLTFELKRREVAYQLMSQQLAQLVEQNTRLKRALETAMLLIDQLISDLRVAGGSPSPGLLATHDKFKATMEKLLEER
jgi:hypothetical protein